MSFVPIAWTLFQGGNEFRDYNNRIVNFFINESDLEFLNVQELSHMQDVRKFVIASNILFMVSIAIVITSFNYLNSHRRFLLEAVRKTSLAVFTSTLIISTIAFVDFNWLFIAFHKIFFIKNFTFPPDSILKILYPDEFFFQLGIVYFLSVMFASLVVAVISHRLKLK
ncbi:MAG: DUF1461 domain-containing protein [Candidatus Aenigmarchaeota archaeon]|nr:DUF1461 domain-containing protein [Candidatus Aenigmarchaeota archaeon]